MSEPTSISPVVLCQCGCGQPTPLASRNMLSRGWVKGQPTRFIQSHNGSGNAKRHLPEYSEEDRGWVSPCWIWQRRINAKGYGRICLTDRAWQAHVLYYVRRYGPLPPGTEIDHKCRVRSCVNPEHLEAVTHTENMRRASCTILTMEIAQEIRQSIATKSATRRELAARYGCSLATVKAIHDRRLWR